MGRKDGETGTLSLSQWPGYFWEARAQTHPFLDTVKDRSLKGTYITWEENAFTNPVISFKRQESSGALPGGWRCWLAALFESAWDSFQPAFAPAPSSPPRWPQGSDRQGLPSAHIHCSSSQSAKALRCRRSTEEPLPHRAIPSRQER